MNRRQFMELTGASVLCGGLGASAASRVRKPYNVLIIHTDEHNFRTLGCYREVLPEKEALMWGKPTVDTPYIDSIAKRGMVFDACYAASPSCSPSRASFITGLYPMDTNVIENDLPIREEIETFATALGRAGYATGYAGKWHLAGLHEQVIEHMTAKSGKPAENIYSFPEFYAGWVPQDQALGFADNRFMFDCWHGKKIVADSEGGNPKLFHPREIGDEKTFMTDWLGDRTVEFIEQHRDKPFCYMVSIPDPHGPDTVREPYYGMYKDAPFETPYTAEGKTAENSPAWGQPDSKKKMADDAAYFGMVKCIDDNVGKILRKLDELGLTENTVVVFTSDHGDMRGEHGRQNKGAPYEASAKIPFVIAAPERIPDNRRTSMVFNTVDFKPTLLGLLGVPFAQPSQGRDCSAVLRGEPVPSGFKNITFSRSPGRRGNGWLMAVDGRYKLIAGVLPRDPLWLIDLQTDPEEKVNRAEDLELKPVVQSLSSALLEYALAHQDPNLPLGNLRQKLEAAAR